MLFPVPTVIATAAAARLASFLLSLSSLATRLQVDEQLGVVVAAAAVAAPLFALSVLSLLEADADAHCSLPTCGVLNLCVYLSRALRCKGAKDYGFRYGRQRSRCRGLYAVSLSLDIFTRYEKHLYVVLMYQNSTSPSPRQGMIVICSNCGITYASSQPFAHKMYPSLFGHSYKLDATSPSACAFRLFALSIARSFVLPIHILVVCWFVPPH